ncbi:LysE family translocator [Flavobacterium caeni]|uniref:Threonine/homoserine/homoserine lactone efflux protein n=1 Tax=Flavobacterium caeni TaxID=490189 RepID=A0A1G5G892_9FLAO|nr:LysE family transporter [Flavobacterium caeni]SCY46958.1 Threonine/homoserine/homoserine lactone efflux protein [Flavobacterium caeni]
MNIALPLFLGFLASSVGITPPGLINMTAAKVGLKEGRTPALVFSAGASLVVVCQALIAVLFAKFLDKHPEVIVLLREVGLAIFGALTIYFFVAGRKAKPEKKEIKLHSKRSRFFMGMLLSSLNFFPIPFYVFISLMLSSYKLFVFEKIQIYLFVLGAGLGAYFAFYCYIAFFKKMELRTQFLLKNMNYIIGSVTGLVSVLTLFEILDYYFG